jgi:hypothetical protein
MKRSKNFYFIIYKKFREGSYPTKIAKELGITKQNLEYYLILFKNEQIVRKIGKGAWEVLKDLTEKDFETFLKNQSKKDSSLGVKENFPKMNLHRFQIRFPILEGEVRDSDWEIKEKLKNWIPKYKKLHNIGGLGLKNNNNKSITLWITPRNIRKIEEVNELAFKVKNFVFEYFVNKHNVILDIDNCETKDMHLAIEDSNLEGIHEKGENFELDLNKKAAKIFPKDNLNAKAWIDGSPYKHTVETNDKFWKECYLKMPFAIMGLSNSMPAISEYNENIILHLEVQREQLKTLKKIQRSLDKSGK